MTNRHDAIAPSISRRAGCCLFGSNSPLHISCANRRRPGPVGRQAAPWRATELRQLLIHQRRDARIVDSGMVPASLSLGYASKDCLLPLIGRLTANRRIIEYPGGGLKRYTTCITAWTRLCRRDEFLECRLLEIEDNMETMNRRAFLGAALTAAAAARSARAAWPRIKLSLSGRISEPIGRVTNLKPLTFDEFLHIAKSTGYDAICI